MSIEYQLTVKPQLEAAKQLSINIFLYEEFLKEPYYWERKIAKNSLDLFTPSGFFLLWEKAQREEWWENFIIDSNWPVNNTKDNSWIDYLAAINNPLTFPALLAEYLGWKE